MIVQIKKILTFVVNDKTERERKKDTIPFRKRSLLHASASNSSREATEWPYFIKSLTGISCRRMIVLLVLFVAMGMAVLAAIVGRGEVLVVLAAVAGRRGGRALAFVQVCSLGGRRNPTL